MGEDQMQTIIQVVKILVSAHSNSIDKTKNIRH